jgi:hypothetical protein
LAIFAALCGCILSFFLSASPASAQESPHADPGILEGITAAISQSDQPVDQQVASGVDAVAATLPAGSHLAPATLAPVIAPLRTVTHTVTATATQLTANVAELIFSLPIPELAAALPDVQVSTTIAPTRALDHGSLTSFVTSSAASATSTANAVTTAVEASPISPFSPVNGYPVLPPRDAVISGSSSGGAAGGSALAIAGENDWAPRLGSGVSSTSNNSVPSSSNDGSDPAPD